MRVIGLMAATVLVLLVAGCATPPAATPQMLADLRSAIADLEVEPGTKPGPRYYAARRVISSCESPGELREIARQFDNPRPTDELESVDNGNGPGMSPHYSIGNALFFAFKRRFFKKSQYMLPGRNCPTYFDSETTFVTWLEEHEYDITRLRKAYERDTPKGS